LKDIEDDDEAVQEKFNSVVGEEVIEPEEFFTRQRIIVLLTSVIVAGSIIFPLFLYAVNFIALFALDITGNHISRVTPKS
jgi:hypothetical protein